MNRSAQPPAETPGDRSPNPRASRYADHGSQDDVIDAIDAHINDAATWSPNPAEPPLFGAAPDEGAMYAALILPSRADMIQIDAADPLASIADRLAVHAPAPVVVLPHLRVWADPARTGERNAFLYAMLEAFLGAVRDGECIASDHDRDRAVRFLNVLPTIGRISGPVVLTGARASLDNTPAPLPEHIAHWLADILPRPGAAMMPSAVFFSACTEALRAHVSTGTVDERNLRDAIITQVANALGAEPVDITLSDDTFALGLLHAASEVFAEPVGSVMLVDVHFEMPTISDGGQQGDNTAPEQDRPQQP